MDRNADSAAEAVDAHERDDDPDALDVADVVESRGERLFEPRPREPSVVHRHPVDHLQRGLRQRAERIVLAAHAVGGEGFLAFCAQPTPLRVAHLGRDGHPLRARPPGSRLGQPPPRPPMGGRKILADRKPGGVVGDLPHRRLPYGRLTFSPEPRIGRMKPMISG
jgi:hypothetical protein